MKLTLIFTILKKDKTPLRRVALRKILLSLCHNWKHMPKHSSIYFHIPFCKRLCGYCDFPKTISLARKEEVLAAMAEEVAERSGELMGTELKTIYFGGGTPTVCTPAELGGLIATVESRFDLSGVEEVTVEANPDDLSEAYLAELREVGVNRLSVGIQSFRDSDLQMMNRRHDAAGAVAAIEAARRAGFDNISIDLIYGLPDATPEDWRWNVERAVELGVEHISAYHLTIEENTLFGKRGVQCAPEEWSEQEYGILCEVLRGAGYEHYEISNFALRGRRSRHNGAYWQGTPYLGIGPGAHSYDGERRRMWNVPSVGRYLDGVRAECETLSDTELYEEYVMVRLRTSEGVDLAHMEERFGRDKVAQFLRRAEAFVKRGVLRAEQGRVAFDEMGWLVSDGVIEEFF